MMQRTVKYRAWLIREKRLVTVDAIIWNKGYGGALQIHIDNPEFDPIKHIVERKENEEFVHSHFSYTNHTLPAYLARHPHEFVLQQFTGMYERNNPEEGREIFEGDILKMMGARDGAGPVLLYQVCWVDMISGFILQNVKDENDTIPLISDQIANRWIVGHIYEKL